MVIKRLTPDVINRIAAGEVIVRPTNAVKELMENSLDACASCITIIIGGGGLQTINILDDGKGISVDDHTLLCERFATSKLRTADDLSDGSLHSFGFRGEALASISLVSHIAVTSKTEGDHASAGYESRFKDGCLLPGYPLLVPFSGHMGTRIVIDDLFYNNPVRKRAFKNPSTEYKKILELVSRFAISFTGVEFKVRKLGGTSFDLFEEVSDARKDSRLRRIESLTGISQHQRELLLWL
jgi:DNA mismatch repair protein MLH1